MHLLGDRTVPEALTLEAGKKSKIQIRYRHYGMFYDIPYTIYIIYVYIYICIIYVYMYVYMYIYICMCICIYVCLFAMSSDKVFWKLRETRQAETCSKHIRSLDIGTLRIDRAYYDT